MNRITDEMKFALAVGLFTSRLYLSPAESFHPPTATVTLSPLFFKAATLSKNSEGKIKTYEYILTYLTSYKLSKIYILYTK